jgi:hypothetical protein
MRGEVSALDEKFMFEKMPPLEKQIYQLRQSTNVDEMYMAARLNTNRSLAKVNDVIARNHADFFYNRVISLNLLAKE